MLNNQAHQTPEHSHEIIHLAFQYKMIYNLHIKTTISSFQIFEVRESFYNH